MTCVHLLYLKGYSLRPKVRGKMSVFHRVGRMQVQCNRKLKKWERPEYFVRCPLVSKLNTYEGSAVRTVNQTN